MLTVGRLMRTHGVRGDLLCEPHSHDLARHARLRAVTLERADGSTCAAEVSASSLVGGASSIIGGKLWKLHLKGIDSPEAAQAFVNAFVLVPDSERVPLPAGQYYFSDLEGFDAVDSQGESLGKITAVLELPSVNAFEVQLARPGAPRVLVPWTDACVGEVRIPERQVEMDREAVMGLLEP
jgi:16S rRNA processing protein RimM